MVCTRKVWGVLGLLLALVVVVGYGQQPLQPPSAQEFWALFQQHKDRCPEKGESRDFWYTLLSVAGDSYAVFWDRDPTVPAGNYDDAHTFGWFYGDIEWGRALQPVLLGSYTRGIMSGFPNPSIPPYPGFRNQSGPQPVHIHSPDQRPLGAIGYFVNFAYHPAGKLRHIGGLYYSDKALNKDGRVHMKLLQINPPKSYFILCWEDSYNYGVDQDFNDLFIGLFHYLRQ